MNKASLITIPAKISWAKNVRYRKRSKEIIFNNLLSFFSFHGVVLRNPRPLKLLQKFLAIFYHFLWLIGTLGTAMCLVESVSTKLPSSFYLFSAAVKIISILLWWILFRERRKINRLLRTLSDLHYQLIGQIQPFKKMINFSLFAFVLFTLEPGVNNIDNTIKEDTVRPECFQIYIPLPSKAARVCAYFLIQVNHQLVNWSLSYLTNLLVIFCCLELSHLVNFLTKKVDKSSFNKLFETYEDLFEAILLTEDTLSLICFICLVRLFMEFFRVFSLLFNFVRGKPQSASVINAGTYGLVTGALFIAMIFTADNVQKKFQELERRLMKKASHDRSAKNGFSFREQVLGRNKDAILTGWGIFELKKKLFLSTLASLITYGVLLQQLQQ